MLKLLVSLFSAWCLSRLQKKKKKKKHGSSSPGVTSSQLIFSNRKIFPPQCLFTIQGKNYSIRTSPCLHNQSIGRANWRFRCLCGFIMGEEGQKLAFHFDVKTSLANHWAEGITFHYSVLCSTVYSKSLPPQTSGKGGCF